MSHKKYHVAWRVNDVSPLLTEEMTRWLAIEIHGFCELRGWPVIVQTIQPDYVHLLMSASPDIEPKLAAEFVKKVAAARLEKDFAGACPKWPVWSGETLVHEATHDMSRGIKASLAYDPETFGCFAVNRFRYRRNCRLPVIEGYHPFVGELVERSSLPTRIQSDAVVSILSRLFRAATRGEDEDWLDKRIVAAMNMPDRHDLKPSRNEHDARTLVGFRRDGQPSDIADFYVQCDRLRNGQYRAEIGLTVNGSHQPVVARRGHSPAVAITAATLTREIWVTDESMELAINSSRNAERALESSCRGA